jgi:ribosomal protein S18 acetylase RimI-like enzyme
VTEGEMIASAEKNKSRFFCVQKQGNLIGYLKINETGENFITRDPGLINICGAYLLPEYRGVGIYTQLLSYSLYKLKTEGYQYVGVDFESANPTARGFWLKYFTPYTHSLVRRVDERIKNQDNTHILP